MQAQQLVKEKNMGGPGSGRRKGANVTGSAKKSAFKNKDARVKQIMSKSGISKSRAKVVAAKEKQLTKSKITSIKRKNARAGI